MSQSSLGYAGSPTLPQSLHIGVSSRISNWEQEAKPLSFNLPESSYSTSRSKDGQSQDISISPKSFSLPFPTIPSLEWVSFHDHCRFLCSALTPLQPQQESFFFFFFFQMHPRYIEIPKLGVELELQPTPQLQQCWIQAASVTYSHSS